MTEYSIPDIAVRLPGQTTTELWSQLKETIRTRLICWVHAYKMDEEQWNRQIVIAGELNLPVIFDIGSLPRVKENLKNPLFNLLPNGDIAVKVSIDQKVILAPLSITQDESDYLTKTYDAIVIRTTQVPLFHENGQLISPERIFFGDEDIEGECELISWKNVNYILVKIDKIKPNKHIYANHKISSSTDPFTELPTPTKLDFEMLNAIPNENRQFVTYVALSFSTSKGIQLLRKYLDRNGYNHTEIVAKIESERGITEIESIADQTSEIMLALGDLYSVCVRSKWNLYEVVLNTLERLRNFKVNIYAAGGLADSLIDSNRLSYQEKCTLIALRYLDVKIFGLTRETFTTYNKKLLDNSLRRIRRFEQYLKFAGKVIVKYLGT